jgi:hypothetical protein
MATVKVKGLDRIRKSFNRKIKIAINKAFRSKEIRQTVARIVVADIRDSIFRAAAPSTQRTREYLETYNETHPKYDQRLINVTFSGKLLEDLINNAKADTVNLAIVIDHSDKKHPGYKTANGRLRADLTYKKLSQILIEDQNLDYLQLTPEGSKKVRDFIIPKLNDLITQELNS